MQKLIYLLLCTLFFSCSSEDPDPIDQPNITKIGIVKPVDNLFVGDEYQFKVICLPNSNLSPKYSWLCADTLIAKIDSQGVLTALKEGEVLITASVADLKISDSIKIKITSKSTTPPITNPTTPTTPKPTSSTCGARTKDGTPCKRKVSGGGRCWQHK